MNLKVLRCFVEVVRKGRFSAAAQVVCTTQSAVSKAIKSLEDDCETVLLERMGHGVSLTAAGEVMYRRALAILTEKESLDAELADLNALRQGTLRFGVPPVASNILFSKQFTEFHRRYPQIRIELREAGCYALEEAVQQGELEMALALLPVSDSFETSPVCDEPLVALLPEGHKLCSRDSLQLEDLDGSAFIQFVHGFALNPRIRAACLQRGVHLHEALCSGQMEFIISLVAAGLGMALVPRLLVAGKTSPGVHTVLLDEDTLRWQAVLAWRKGYRLSPAAKAWLELMQTMPFKGVACPTNTTSPHHDPAAKKHHAPCIGVQKETP